MQANNENRFAVAPTVTAPRSKFLMHQNIRTTFNAAKLIPFFVDTDIMPGDTFKISGAVVIRMSTPIYPTMDNLWADIRFWFIPHRLVWNNFKQFMGENETGSWAQTTEFEVPQIKFNSNESTVAQLQKGDFLQYMGIPLGLNENVEGGIKVNALASRAYCLTWNEWYRDENFCPPIYINKGDQLDYLTRQANKQWGYYSVSNAVPAECAPVYKFKDYLSANLPEPQKGSPIALPVGQSAPLQIYGDGKAMGMTDGTFTAAFRGSNNNSQPFMEMAVDGYGKATGTSVTGQNIAGSDSQFRVFGLTTDPDNSGLTGIADLSQAVAATVNAQRMAFAAQRILETSARAGTRYCEILDAFFGIKDPNSARLQRPEYIGGCRLPINQQQVLQTSSTDSTSPQGNTAAYSLTVDARNFGTKSFVEHGTLLGVLCVRQEHSYSQSIARMWKKKRKLDWYWPQLAFLGEQPTYNYEVRATGNETEDNEVFGYNERWAELRSKVNINTGAFSTVYAQSLDSWHYGDLYETTPVLSDAWRRETKDYIDRTLAVTSEVEDQFLMDSRWNFETVRCVPMFSIPGLLDHF